MPPISETGHRGVPEGKLRYAPGTRGPRGPKCARFARPSEKECTAAAFEARVAGSARFRACTLKAHARPLRPPDGEGPGPAHRRLSFTKVLCISAPVAPSLSGTVRVTACLPTDASVRDAGLPLRVSASPTLHDRETVEPDARLRMDASGTRGRFSPRPPYGHNPGAAIWIACVVEPIAPSSSVTVNVTVKFCDGPSNE